MAMQTEEGGIPREYVARSIYQSDMMNPYNGWRDNREIASAENDILYGGSQIEVNGNKRTGKAGMHDQTDPNRGRGETWYSQMSSMTHPLKATPTARLNNREEEAMIHVPDLTSSLVVLRHTQEAA